MTLPAASDSSIGFLDLHSGTDSARVPQLSRRPIVQAGKFIVTKLDAEEFDCMANVLGVICDNLILVAASPIVGNRERLFEYLVTENCKRRYR
jgi:hypothetical protein